MKLTISYPVLITFILVATLWVLVPSIMNWLIDGTENLETKGQYGDMYGIVTSFFSGITLILLVYTVLQQQQQIKISENSLNDQMKQTQLNREELQDTRKEFEQQNRTLSLQRFETTFFNLLNLQTFITNNLKFYPQFVIPFRLLGTTQDIDIKPPAPLIGKEVVKNEMERLAVLIGKEEFPYNPLDDEHQNQFYKIQEIYTNYYIDSDPLKQYLENIDTISDFILRSEEIQEHSKPFYIKLLSSQLTEYELAYYFYYQTLILDKRYDEKSLKGLDILSHVRQSSLLHDTHINFYFNDAVSGDS